MVFCVNCSPNQCSSSHVKSMVGCVAVIMSAILIIGAFGLVGRLGMSLVAGGCITAIAGAINLAIFVVLLLTCTKLLGDCTQRL